MSSHGAFHFRVLSLVHLIQFRPCFQTDYLKAFHFRVLNLVHLIQFMPCFQTDYLKAISSEQFVYPRHHFICFIVWMTFRGVLCGRCRNWGCSQPSQSTARCDWSSAFSLNSKHSQQHGKPTPGAGKAFKDTYEKQKSFMSFSLVPHQVLSFIFSPL